MSATAKSFDFAQDRSKLPVKKRELNTSGGISSEFIEKTTLQRQAKKEKTDELLLCILGCNSCPLALHLVFPIVSGRVDK